MSAKGFKCPFSPLLHVTTRATTDLVVAPTWQNPQIKLRHIPDSLEPTFYQNVLLCKSEDQGEESSVLQGFLLDICLWWKCEGCLLPTSGPEAGLAAQGLWVCLIQLSIKPLISFSTALVCIMPCPGQDAAVRPCRCTRLSSFHSLFQGALVIHSACAGPCRHWWIWPALRAWAAGSVRTSLCTGARASCVRGGGTCSCWAFATFLRSSGDTENFFVVWEEETLLHCKQMKVRVAKTCIQQWLCCIPTGQGQGVYLKVDVS